MVNRCNSTATYSPEDIRAIKQAHEEMTRVRTELAAFNEKVANTEEFIRHNFGNETLLFLFITG